MIEVKYDGGWRLKVSGHAGSGEPGHDLVCAAASILLYTLAENLRELLAGGMVTGLVTELRPGAAKIECTPAEGRGEAVRGEFESIMQGFRLLARDRGQFVSVSG